jgi:hypothetical protein
LKQLWIREMTLNLEGGEDLLLDFKQAFSSCPCPASNSTSSKLSVPAPAQQATARGIHSNTRWCKFSMKRNHQIRIDPCGVKCWCCSGSCHGDAHGKNKHLSEARRMGYDTPLQSQLVFWLEAFENQFNVTVFKNVLVIYMDAK